MRKVRSKLYPTKIGVIKTFSLSPNDEIGEIAVECSGCTYYYNNLAELCEKWEDVPEEEIQVHIEGIQNVFMGGFGRVYIDYATAKEAEKAVRKLKAWERLKDNSFRFVDLRFEYDELSGTIKFRTNLYGGINDDLDLLFGGKDD